MQEKTYKLSSKSLSTALEEEIVVLNYEKGGYYGLDGIGKLIWEYLKDKPATVAELKKLILEEYDIDATTCEQDIVAFLKELEDEKLVESI